MVARYKWGLQETYWEGHRSMEVPAQPTGEEQIEAWESHIFEMVHLDVAIAKETCQNVREENHFLKHLSSGVYYTHH